MYRILCKMEIKHNIVVVIIIIIIIERNLPITEPQWNAIIFSCRRVPFNTGTWELAQSLLNFIHIYLQLGHRFHQRQFSVSFWSLLIVCFFLLWRCSLTQAWVSISHTTTHTHPVRLLCMSDQFVADATTYTTKQTGEANIRFLSGIGTRDAINRAAAYLGLNPHGHLDRQLPIRCPKCILLQVLATSLPRLPTFVSGIGIFRALTLTDYSHWLPFPVFLIFRLIEPLVHYFQRGLWCSFRVFRT